MPLLEVVQTRHISASIRLTDSTANQVDQYAAFIGAPADQVIEEALKHCFSKDRDFQDFLKTPEAKRAAATLRIRKAPVAEAANRPRRSPQAERSRRLKQQQWRDRKHDTAPSSVAGPQRRCAPEEGLTLHP